MSQNQISFFTAGQGLLQGNFVLLGCFTCKPEISNDNFRKKYGKTKKNDDDIFLPWYFLELPSDTGCSLNIVFMLGPLNGR